MKQWLCAFLALLLTFPGAPMAKQDVTVWLYYSGDWHNVTEKVRIREQITINHGAGNEQNGIVPSDASLTFDNRDGEMNPENRKSSLYGLIGHNTPIEIEVGEDKRFSGQIVSWKPRRAIKGDAWVQIRAQGTIRRLGQGEPPVRSALFHTIMYESTIRTLLAYWPLEDGASADQFASALSDGLTMNVPAQALASNDDTLPGSLPLPTFTHAVAEQASGLIPNASLSGTVMTWDLWAKTPLAGEYVDANLYTKSDHHWHLTVDNVGRVDLFYYDTATSSPTTPIVSDAGLMVGTWHNIRFTLTQNGGNVDCELFFDGVSIETGSTAGSVTAPTEVTLEAEYDGSEDRKNNVGHITVWDGIPSQSFYETGLGYPGERAGNRFQFLGVEAGISTTIVGDATETQKMGPQFGDTFLNWMDEIAKTDAGIVHDTRDELGLTMRTGRSLYNQDPAVTLDFEGGQVVDPLEPDIDDLGRINVVVASRRNGGSAIARDENGALGTATIGAYESKVDINPESDTALPYHAAYHLTLGTDPDPRYAQVTVDLTEQDATFITEVSAVDIGDLLELQNLPEDLGQPTAELLVLGYTEVVGTHTRRITFNTRPGGILTNVGQLDGDGAACLQTSGAQLSSSITAEQVSFSVATTSGPIFTTSPPTGAKIVVADREVMTVTAISGSSSPQTFTVTRDPEMRMAHASAASVRVYQPLRLVL